MSIPIGAPVTATMPGGEKTHGLIESVDSYMKETMYLIRNCHDLDCKWFRGKEVKIRVQHRTIAMPFTLWQLQSLLGYSMDIINWEWEGDSLCYIYEYFNLKQDRPLINKLIKYNMPVPFTLWALNTELLCNANASWQSIMTSSDLCPVSIYDYRERIKSELFQSTDIC